ncbi:hypothetical protein [uncultured Maricaulis sp.]|uniref:hypothetical protein n=1 Tax=uncultured Maricaulis sp. TaxID=174710 RepID=UPI0030DD8573
MSGLRTYSTAQFEIRIADGLLEMRTEGLRTPDMGAEPQRAMESLFKDVSVRAVAFDIRASDFRITNVELESRVRQIGRQCRGLPIAFISRDDQKDQIRIALGAIGQMNGIARGFRSRDKAHAWLREVSRPA